MTKIKKSKGYRDADIKAVSDTPEITPEQFAHAKPFGDVFPVLAENMPFM